VEFKEISTALSLFVMFEWGHVNYDSCIDQHCGCGNVSVISALLHTSCTNSSLQIHIYMWMRGLSAGLSALQRTGRNKRSPDLFKRMGSITSLALLARQGRGRKYLQSRPIFKMIWMQWVFNRVWLWSWQTNLRHRDVKSSAPGARKKSLHRAI